MGLFLADGYQNGYLWGGGLNQLGRFDSEQQMADDNDKSDIVLRSPRGLAKQVSNLVRRGLDDLTKEIPPGYSGNPAADAWIEKGLNFEASGSHAEAISCFESAIEIHPRCVHAWRHCGVACGSWAHSQPEITVLQAFLVSLP